MCDVGAAIGAVASLGSALMQRNAQDTQADAVRQQQQAEIERQDRLQRQAEATADTARAGYEGAEDKRKAKADEAAAYIQSQSQVPGASEAAALPPSTSQTVVQDAAGKRANAQGFLNQQAKAQGELRSLGDVLGRLALDQARTTHDVGLTQGFMRGSANVLPLQLDQAKRDNQPGMLGDALRLGGQAATAYGLQGGFTSSAGGAGQVAAPTKLDYGVGLGRIY